MDPNFSSSAHYTSYPILAVSIIGILATAILLLSYYLFITKCCFSGPRRRTDLYTLHHYPTEPLGLDISTINSIPTFRFSAATTSAVECAVCLADFKEQELLRVLSGCSHAFHIDCIDTWLQSSANCPLCRSQISLLPSQKFNAPTVTEQDSSVAIQVRERRRCWEMVSKGDECIDVRCKDDRFEVKPTMRRSFSMDSSSNRELYISVQEILGQSLNPNED